MKRKEGDQIQNQFNDFLQNNQSFLNKNVVLQKDLDKFFV